MNQRVKIITNNSTLKEVSWKIDLYGTMADKIYSSKGIDFLTIWIAYGLIDNLEFNLDEIFLEDSIEFN